MANQEYIIISKTDIETRIEEINVLKKNIIKNMKELYQALNQNAIEYYKYKQNLSYNLSMLTTESRTLKQILSQSKPLTTEIEKAFDAGNKRGWSGYPNTDNWTQPRKQEYISNLKLKV